MKHRECFRKGRNELRPYVLAVFAAFGLGGCYYSGQIPEDSYRWPETTVGGETDWRLPDKDELSGLVNVARSNPGSPVGREN